MTLLIAVLIIVAFKMSGWLIVLSSAIWLVRLFYYYPNHMGPSLQTIVDNQISIGKRINLVMKKLDKIH